MREVILQTTTTPKGMRKKEIPIRLKNNKIIIIKKNHKKRIKKKFLI